MEALQLPCRRIHRNYPLNRISFVGTRGKTRLYIKPESKDELVYTLNHLAQQGIPFIVCGASSNMLWGDGYYEGAVVDTSGIKQVEIKGTRLFASCGVMLNELVKICVEEGLSGLEELWGIPGTLGGALVMNAGAFGREIGELVEEVECWKDTEVFVLKKEELSFGYRFSSLKQCIILSAKLALKAGREPEKRVAEVDQLRKVKFPQGPSLGCVFKNPLPFYAGRLIEEAGLKGYSIGRVRISEKHANFFLSPKEASAKDFVKLAEFVKVRVLETAGVSLTEEIVYAGAFV